MELDLKPIELPGIEKKRPMIIAGPCSAETEQQVMDTALMLANKGIKIFRAGIWKPRTKPGGFEGIGVDGLAWLKRVKQETGMYVATEVATAKHVYECLKAGIDVLWIGARTTANPFAVQEIADSLKGVAHAWEPSTADSPASTRRFTATLPCGTSPSNCIAVSPTCPSSATRATSADAAT